MINTKNLVLTEITREEYKKLDIENSLNSELPPNSGFALISTPLEFPDYISLLRAAIDTERARCVSLRIFGQWLKIKREALRAAPEREIRKLANLANIISFIYFHFHEPSDRTTHEIKFAQQGEHRILSTQLIAPGYRVDEYTWKGSTTNFFM